MEVLNTAFFEPEDSPCACAECGSEHMDHPYETSFCSSHCYTVFFDFINDNEPVERQVFVTVYDDDDNMSCASDETFLSIYTYVRVGKKHYSKQLKNRIVVKVSEKYGSAYDTGTV